MSSWNRSTLESSAMQSQRYVSVLLMAVCALYFLGTVFLQGWPVIEFMWALILVILLAFAKHRSTFKLLLIYFIFTIFYSSYVSFDSQEHAAYAYYRRLISSFILSALLLASLKLDLRRMRTAPISPRLLRFIQLMSIIALAGWALVALRNLNSGDLIYFRDVTGEGYLTLSDTFALFSLSYLCREKIPGWEFATVFGLSVVVIILLGSRTTIILYPFAVAFLVVRQFSISAAIGWSVVLGAGAFYWLKDTVDLESNAFFRLNTLFSLSSDESEVVRDMFRNQMLDRIMDHPECLLLACPPEQGAYDHSIFSVIQYFGFAGIIFLIFSIFLCIVKFPYFVKQWYFPIFIYCVLALSMSRAWVALVFPVFVAFVVDAALASSPRRRKSVERGFVA